MKWTGLAALALAAATPAPAAAQAPISANADSAIDRAQKRGALIHAYDRAAWLGTDDMLAKLPDAQQKVGGWIVDGPASSPTLVFFDRNVADPKGVYVVKFVNGKLVGAGAAVTIEDQALSPQRRRMVDALRVAREKLGSEKTEACTDKPFNSVVLPPERDGGPVLVYFLTPQRKLDEIPIGRHYLVEVAEGGGTTVRAFTNSCFFMPAPKAKKKKDRPAALFVTHLLDPTPTELHVFSALASGYPLMVATVENRKIWGVTGSEVVQVGSLDE